VAERYSTSTRTIERWEIDPALNFPKPIKIKRRKYWYEDELDEFDAAQG
jgi:predicted DNA-binding transcriptional regulator AlpA